MQPPQRAGASEQGRRLPLRRAGVSAQSGPLAARSTDVAAQRAAAGAGQPVGAGKVMPARLAGAPEHGSAPAEPLARRPERGGTSPRPGAEGQAPRGRSQPWPARAAVLADDLTGALDGGVQLLPLTSVEVLVDSDAREQTGPTADSAIWKTTRTEGGEGHGGLHFRISPSRPTVTPGATNEATSVGRASKASVRDPRPAATPKTIGGAASVAPAADPADRAHGTAPPASHTACAAAGTEEATDAAVMQVINTQSRGLAPAAAAARVRAVCRGLRAQGRTVWFKKLDSTLRGNVGAELAALHEALAPCVIVCTPALPAEGRTVQDGVLRVAGEPVMATPYRDEIPAGAGAGAANSSAVIDVVRRQWPECRAAHLPPSPRGPAFAEAVNGPVDLVLVDAAGDDDLNALAASTGGGAPDGRKLVWAGSAGLLRALASTGASGSEVARGKHGAASGGATEPVPCGPLVLVCGSRRRLSHGQVDRAAGAASRPLTMRPSEAARSLPDVADDENDARGRSRRPARSDQAPGALGVPRWHVSGGAAGRPSALHAADAAEISAAALAQGRDLFLCAPVAEPTGPQPPHLAGKVAANLANLAASVLTAAAVRPRALLLVGGDTAYACLRRLAIARLVLRGEAEPYVPWARVRGGPWAGLMLVTKAGGFGDLHTLRRIYAQLRGGT